MADVFAKLVFHRQRVIELLFRLEDPLDQPLLPLEALIHAKLQVGDFRLGRAQARRQLRLYVPLNPAQRFSSACNSFAILPDLGHLKDPRANQFTSPSGRLAASILVLGSILVAATGIKASDRASLPGGPEKEVWIGPFGAQRVEVRMLLPQDTNVRPGDQLTGVIWLFDAALLPVESFPERLPTGRWLMKFFLPYDTLSPEILARANTETLNCRFTGALRSGAASRPIEFRQRIPRDHLQLTESMKVTLLRFVRVYETHLGHVGLGRATINIDLDILVPLGFDLKFLEARYTMDVNERKVSRGQKEKFLLHGGRWNRLEFPIEIEYRGLLAAAGKAAVSGGRVEGKLTGLARLRLPSGDLDFPFEFPVRIALL
jgi:hypothetical protein